jgi:aryl-phospho-beta-D-glucosidase BglC (GH1 family)
MKTLNAIILIVVAVFLSCNTPKQSSSLSFLHTSGQNIVNESGEIIYLKGVGLGNWLLPEGYMWKFGPSGDRPRKIEKVVSDLVGEEKADQFWKQFRKNYITEADIKRIAELGFNSVRPALNSRVFLTEEANPVFIEEGFQLIDSLVAWCRKYKIYVIIDLHGAPGGQTGANIDDSPNDIPELFINQKYQDQTVNLWVKIADRYKDEPVVAAYDLLNEPLPINTGSADKYKQLLIPLYKRITSEIRKVDQKHMITLEGFNWSNDWSLFDKPLDNNVFYQFHYYCWSNPDELYNINYFLKKRNELNTPVWVGETGEKNNKIYWGTSQYFETNNIGFSFWPWKKMDTKNTPYSIRKPDNWDLISSFTDGGSKPDSSIAEKALNELLENIKLANCDYFEDVTNAILTQIPGKIEAENYGHQGYNNSYYVKDTMKMSGQYRKSEPVQIKLIECKNESEISEQFVNLQKTEWVVYNFRSLEKRNYQITIKTSADIVPAKIKVQINDQIIENTVINKDLTELNLGNYYLNKGDNKVRIQILSNSLNIDWICFK